MSEAKSYFNSIKVRLKLQKYNITSALILYFNSIKVRLKRAAPQYVAKYVKFQFHKGTIKTQDGSFKYKDYLISIP